MAATPVTPTERIPSHVKQLLVWLPLLVEYGFALEIVVLVVQDLLNLYNFGYLPQPFFYDVSDTFMDWFNPAYFAHNGHAYETFGSIYPPLTFVVMKLFSIPKCYVFQFGYETRGCDWVGVTTLLVSYVIDIVLAWRIMRWSDPRTALPRTIAIGFGMPILFGLERGNIILMTFAFVMLAFGPLLRSARWRWFFAALAINLKVYLIGAVVALLLRRRWMWVEGALLATVLVWFVTYMMLGEGTPGEVVHNIIGYNAAFVSAQNVLDMWYSDTYQPLLSVLQAQTFPLLDTVGSPVVDTASWLVPAMVLSGQASVALAALATWLRPEVVPTHRVIFFGMIMAIISSESSGYTVCLPIFLVFMEKWRGVGRAIALVTAYILSLPSDIVLSQVPPLAIDSYFAGRYVEVHYGIGIGMFLRPGLVLVLATALSWVTIADVWRDIRTQGWHGRWRFRRDVPMLPGVLRPEQVADSNG